MSRAKGALNCVDLLFFIFFFSSFFLCRYQIMYKAIQSENKKVQELSSVFSFQTNRQDFAV